MLPCTRAHIMVTGFAYTKSFSELFLVEFGLRAFLSIGNANIILTIPKRVNIPKRAIELFKRKGD